MLKDGDWYKNKVTGMIIKLIQDYDGVRWYLKRIDDYGHTKTLSHSESDMLRVVSDFYEKVYMSVWDKFFEENLSMSDFIKLKEMDIISEKLYVFYETTKRLHGGDGFIEYLEGVQKSGESHFKNF